MPKMCSNTNRLSNGGKNAFLTPQNQGFFFDPSNTQDSYNIGTDNIANRRFNSDRAAFSVEEVALKLGVGRNTIYSVLNSGALASFKIGTRRLISSSALENFIHKMEEENIYVQYN